MEIIIKRISMHADQTVGCVQVYFSGAYQSKVVPQSQLRTAPWGAQWVLLGQTHEPRAMAWVDRPLIGQRAGVFRRHHTAMPEGRFRLALHHSRRYKRMLPTLRKVPMYGNVCIRSLTRERRPSADILVPRQTLKTLVLLVEEARAYGEGVAGCVRSRFGFTFPLKP